MNFQIVGADRETEEDVEIIVDARDEVDAETIPSRRKIMGSSVVLVRSLPQEPQPSPPVAPKRNVEQCPKCKEWIDKSATKCPHCHSAREAREHRPTFAQIQQQIKALGEVDTFGTKKEIKYPPDILTEGETILALTSRLMDGNTWLIVCTEKRVVLLDKGMIYGLKQREIPLERINSIEQKTGMILGRIGIWDGASHMEIRNVMKETVRPFVEAVNRARDAQKSADERSRSSAATSGADFVCQLERLADLRGRGILTDEEFQTQKSEILGA